MASKKKVGGALASAALVVGVASTELTNTTTTTSTTSTTAETTTEPAPAPTPVYEPAPATATLAGISVTAQPLDRLTTRSGIWAIHDLGAIEDARAYLWRLSTAPDFLRVVVCRRIFTKEKADSTAVSLLSVPVHLETAGKVQDWSLTVPQGACRVVQNMEPVAPRTEWIRQAVAEGVIPAYRRERAIRPALLKPLAVDAKLLPYDPTSLGGTSSSSNYVGVTSNQGGEYAASRGFLHDADARIVDAALHNEDDKIASVWSQFTTYTFYSLAQPQGAAWSQVNHTTIDPQFPQAGDRAWELSFPAAPNTAIDTIVPATGWARDVSHLENTGFIHWLATEDPIAGLVVQRQAAYALAAYPENYRGGYGTMKAVTTYGGYKEQERGLFNTLSALWKSRDVARRVTSSSGTMIWSLTRAEQQANEVITFYDGLAAKIYNATTATPAEYSAKLSGTLFGGQGTEPYDMADGTQVSFTQTSAFMLQQYGKEPLWLWTKAGDQRVAKWFATYARSLVVRMTVIGGARGVDSVTGIRGSGFPIGPTTKTPEGWMVAAVPSFTTDTGWGEWVVGLQLKTLGPRTSFDGAALHTTLQTEGLLLLAKDAKLSVPQIDTALANIEQWKAVTKSYTYEALQMLKHMASAQ